MLSLSFHHHKTWTNSSCNINKNVVKILQVSFTVHILAALILQVIHVPHLKNGTESEDFIAL
jgi:hypothetical protein